MNTRNLFLTVAAALVSSTVLAVPAEAVVIEGKGEIIHPTPERLPRRVAGPAPTVASGPVATTGPTTKPWVSDFPGYVTGFGGHQWILGRSTRPCATEKEAMDQARSQAAAQVRELLRANVTPARFGGESEAWIRSRVAREMSIGSLVVDRSLSKVKRPYGDVWSAAVLVDASGDRIAPMVREHDAWLRAREVSVRQTTGSILGLGAAILLIYAVMNAATKGYFRGRLRVGGAMALAIGAVWFIVLAR
jgi:hypothetical protein